MIGWLTGRKWRAAQEIGAGPTMPRHRVLLVEDDAHDRERILPVLDALGFAVDTAADADEGLRQEGLREYAGAIVDLNLSSTPARSGTRQGAGADRCEGFALISELRKRGRRYPIVILTHHEEREYKLRGFAAGADDYMVKWPRREEMRTRLGRLMADRGAQDQDLPTASQGQ